MSEDTSTPDESDGQMITDDQLPEDLVPSEDNPLAQGPEDDATEGSGDDA